MWNIIDYLDLASPLLKNQPFGNEDIKLVMAPFDFLKVKCELLKMDKMDEDKLTKNWHW